MSLTTKQARGLEIIKERYDAGEPFVTIAGYAGTGKTYLVAEAMKALDIGPLGYKMATFTGKAALVLRQRGFEATTLHKLLYKTIPVRKEKDEFIHLPKKKGEGMDGTKVIVIDEISMVPNYILKEAAKHKIFIIALGDPFQLPPIGEDNGLLDRPHIFLDEIVRQAEGSSIISLSQKVRNFNGSKIEIKNDDNVKLVYRDEVVDGMFEWADQILCSTNKTRKAVNAMVRHKFNFSGVLPENGEKIIFTKNNWDRVNDSGYALVNGMIGIVSNVNPGRKMGLLGQTFTGDVETDFSTTPFNKVLIDGNIFAGKQSIRYSKKDKEKIEHADFGYAITVHKSQGSEFGNVMMYEEKLNSKIDLRLLYTGVTRAKDKIVIVIPREGSRFIRVD